MESIIVLLLVTVFTANISYSYGWGYRASDQRRWNVIHPACGGRQQSPLALQSQKAVPISIPAMELVHYQNPLPSPLMLFNNGHSVSIVLPKYTTEEEKKGFRLPYVFGGPLDNEYEMELLQFHWGDKNNRGSEHVINDQRMPLEMHFIHRNRKYSSISEALQHPDGLCILAFFYQIVEYNADLLTPIVMNMSQIEQYNTSLQLPYTFALSSLLSGLNSERYYTYKGSLTNPPCAEAVTWVIFPDWLPVTVYQIENFRTLNTNLGLPLVDNFRQLQPAFGRNVFLRITASNPRFGKTKLPYSRINWVDSKRTDSEFPEFDE